MVTATRTAGAARGGRVAPGGRYGPAVRRLAGWLIEDAPTGAGAYVMATGVVSVGLSLDGRHTLAGIVLAAATIGWLALGVSFVARLVGDPPSWWARTSQLGALTAIAGTTVLGEATETELGWRIAPLVLWGVAALLWLVVVPRLVLHQREIPPHSESGLVFAITVATQGVSLLASTLSGRFGAPGLAYVGLVLWIAGIFAYLLLELSHFDHRRIVTGPGDQWVLGGAIAITVLAGAKLIEAAGILGVLGGIRDAMVTGETVIWVVGLVPLIVLSWSELAYPRTRYSAARWATSFPVGMYAASTFAAAASLHRPWMDSYFSDWWVWVGFAVWILALLGLLRRIARMWSGRPTSGPTSRPA